MQHSTFLTKHKELLKFVCLLSVTKAVPAAKIKIGTTSIWCSANSRAGKKRWGCVIPPIVIMVCSSCSSLDGLLQKCSRKLHFHLARGSICGVARAPSIPETLLSCLDKKVKLIQIKNIKRFFPASSATLGTFPAPHLHQDCCSLSPALPAKAGTSRDAERVTSNLILKLYLARFFPP